MNRALIAALALAACLPLAGCGGDDAATSTTSAATATTSSATTEARDGVTDYLADLDRFGVDYGGDRQAAVDLGNGICASLADDVAVPIIAISISHTAGFTNVSDEQGTRVVTSAWQHLCPDQPFSTRP